MTPQVDPSLNICNGIPKNEAGLTTRCPFSDSPFDTCVCTLFFSIQRCVVVLQTINDICFYCSMAAQLNTHRRLLPIHLKTIQLEIHYVIDVSPVSSSFGLWC